MNNNVKETLDIPNSKIIAIGTGILSSVIAWAITLNLTLGLISIATFTFLFFVFKFIYAKTKILKTFKMCGIVAVHTNQYEAENSIKERLVSAKHIDILTIRGLGIFALKDSLIKHTLIERAGQINVRVLLLNHTSKYVEMRAREVGEDSSAFRQGIILGQDYLQELKNKHNIKINVYLYDSLPIWRLKFIDNCVYVSSFLPSKEGHHSAMYEITSEQNFSLFDSFKRDFDNMCEVSEKII